MQVGYQFFHFLRVNHYEIHAIFQSIEHQVQYNFEVRNLGDYHDLYVQSDILLLDDVLENFRNMCLEMYDRDPAHFLSAPGLA